jgi:GNAT superfamily N-acetyltransferase
MTTIRKATREDAQTAWTLRNLAIAAQCADDYPPHLISAWTPLDIPDGFAETVEQHLYVADLFGEVVGTGMINLQTGKIDAIFVHPKRVRLGIGAKIVRHLEELARVKGLREMVLESTLNAVEFYRACGFSGDRISQYHSPRGFSLDCVLMSKRIAP